MSYSPELIEEINLLALYNISSIQEGIKVHKAAGAAAVAAAQRLYDKGLTTQADGGYLTNLGIEAAEHAQSLLTILSSV
jgi:uncharacterized protein (TIGR02647 family)